MAERQKKHWSYNAGERGRNWTRAYQDAKDRKFYLEWREEVLDPETGDPVQKRRRALILDEHTRQPVTDPEVVKARADKLAAKFTEAPPEALPPTTVRPTVAQLIDHYLKEVTPTKGESTQDHDLRAGRIFKRLVGRKEPRNLDAGDWNTFIHRRRSGKIEGFGPVGNRQIAYDLKFLIAVLGWATGIKVDGAPLLEFNPWGPEQRRSHRMQMPKEMSPRRPSMTDEIRDRLIEHSPHWQFELALLLGRYTISRNSSVRRMRWSDIDLEAGTVRWRKESDKSQREGMVPLLPEAIEALRRAPRGIGNAWVFPSEVDPSQPTPRDTFQTWMRRAKERAGIRIRGLGFHGEKRAGVRDPWFRELDPKMKETLSRTNHATLINIYDEVELDEMRLAIQRRRPAARASRR